MILVDTAVWIDHLRSPVAMLDRLLDEGDVSMHPFIVGEVGMGSFHNRDEVIAELNKLPRVTVARDDEVQDFVRRHSIFGLGIGYLDAHLLVATKLTPETSLWTRDKRLDTLARRFGLAMTDAPARIN